MVRLNIAVWLLFLVFQPGESLPVGCHGDGYYGNGYHATVTMAMALFGYHSNSEYSDEFYDDLINV